MVSLLGLIGKYAPKLVNVAEEAIDPNTWYPITKNNPSIGTPGKFQFKGDAVRHSWLNYLWKYLDPVLWAIMAIVAAAGAVYAIVLGVNLAKADDQSKREEAKKRLITVLIAVGVTIAFVLFFNLLVPYIIQAFSGDIRVSQLK